MVPRLLVSLAIALSLVGPAVVGRISVPSVRAAPGTIQTAWPNRPSAARAAARFVENVGQFDPRARFQLSGARGTLWLSDDGLWLTLVDKSSSAGITPDGNDLAPMRESRLPLGGSIVSSDSHHQRGVNLHLTFEGANAHPRLEPFDPRPTNVSYFIGSDPSRWHSKVPVWGECATSTCIRGWIWRSAVREGSGAGGWSRSRATWEMLPEVWGACDCG